MLQKKIILSFVGLAVLVGAVAASAIDIDRVAYREKVEPICKTNTEANERILKDARRNVREGKAKKASRQLFAAAKALKGTREQLLKQAWGFDFYGQTRTVDVHIAHLRKKLESGAVKIETVTGVGYKLVV